MENREVVLLRVTANVIGDGHSTIRIGRSKNQDPLRGRDHRSPLEISISVKLNYLYLEQQGYTPDTVLPEGIKPFYAVILISQWVVTQLI